MNMTKSKSSAWLIVPLIFEIHLVSHLVLQGFFQTVWFTTVYRMKIEFHINLIQFHPKPTLLMLGTEVSETFSPQKRIYGEKKK